MAQSSMDCQASSPWVRANAKQINWFQWSCNHQFNAAYAKKKKKEKGNPIVFIFKYNATTTTTWSSSTAFLHSIEGLFYCCRKEGHRSSSFAVQMKLWNFFNTRKWHQSNCRPKPIKLRIRQQQPHWQVRHNQATILSSNAKVINWVGVSSLQCRWAWDNEWHNFDPM